MKQTHKIVMLSTIDRDSKLWYSNDGQYMYDPLGVYDAKPQHLYILSDDEIKEGDWYAYKDRFLDGTVKTQEDFEQANWNIKQCEANETAYTQRAQQGKNAKNGICGCYKIIATTDPKLKVKIHLNSMDGTITETSREIPQIPQSLVEYYAKHQPEEVELEYDEWIDRPYSLKLKNNEVVFKEERPVLLSEIMTGQKLYTHEEVEKLTHTTFLAGALANARGKDMGEYWKWHKENL
jgi:hypothetical protein